MPVASLVSELITHVVVEVWKMIHIRNVFPRRQLAWKLWDHCSMHDFWWGWFCGTPMTPWTLDSMSISILYALQPFAFLVGRPPQSALLHRQALTLLLNRWSACLTGFSILVLKLAFSPDPFPCNLPLSLSNGLISQFLSSTWTEVSGIENIGQCSRLSQLSWLLGAL